MSNDTTTTPEAPRRILDVTLAHQLDTDAETLRRLIVEHRQALETFGELIERPGLNLPGLGKGSPFFMLTEAHAGYLVLLTQREEEPIVSPSLEDELRAQRAVTFIR